MDSFKISDVETCYSEVREQKSKNISTDMANLVAQGFLTLAGEKDGKRTWTITGSGERHVENDLS